MNGIKGIMHHGRWISEPNELKQAVLQQFSSLFSKPHKGRVFGLEGVFKNTLSKEDNDLMEEFTMEEIREVLHQSNELKAPAPDGFNARWIKNMWPHLVDKVLSFFHRFHNDGFIPSGANLSFIILIPKNANPKFISDYRPISLINSSFKVLLKVLAHRLKIR